MLIDFWILCLIKETFNFSPEFQHSRTDNCNRLTVFNSCGYIFDSAYSNTKEELPFFWITKFKYQLGCFFRNSKNSTKMGLSKISENQKNYKILWSEDLIPNINWLYCWASGWFFFYFCLYRIVKPCSFCAQLTTSAK